MEKLPTPSINLAKNRGESVSQRVMTFALTIGRVLVIVTEAIALGAFLFRFGLDRQLVDLHDRITQEQAIVNILKPNEIIYRNLQERLKLSSNLVDLTNGNETLFQDIIAMLPADMAVTTISLSDTTIHIQGSVSTLVSLSGLIKKLKSDTRIDSVSLDKIENKSAEGVINFVVTVTMKPVKTKLLL